MFLMSKHIFPHKILLQIKKVAKTRLLLQQQILWLKLANLSQSTVLRKGDQHVQHVFKVQQNIFLSELPFLNKLVLFLSCY